MQIAVVLSYLFLMHNIDIAYVIYYFCVITKANVFSIHSIGIISGTARIFFPGGEIPLLELK